MVCEGVRDARGPIVGYAFKGEHQDQFKKDLPGTVQRHMTVFEAALVKASGHVVTSGLSTADVLMAELAYECEGVSPGVLDSYPLVKALLAEVVKLPGVAAYLESDKRYPFPHGEVGKVYVANVNAVLGR